MLKQLIKLKLLGMTLVLAAACATEGMPGDEEPSLEPEPEPPAGEGILLSDWVDAMVQDESAPDSVNDKPAIVINVEDQAPFAKYFEQ
jgi:hypothetical protein